MNASRAGGTDLEIDEVGRVLSLRKYEFRDSSICGSS
jgi:hypothetical protein